MLEKWMEKKKVNEHLEVVEKQPSLILLEASKLLKLFCPKMKIEAKLPVVKKVTIRSLA